MIAEEMGMTECVPGRPGAAAALRRRRDQPGGGAGARQPRRPALDPDVDAARSWPASGGAPSGRSARSCSGRRCWAACCSSIPGTCSAISLLIGSILAYGAVITSLGLAMATRVSRLGRAVALCVSAYVVFSIGWPILVVMLVRETSRRALPGHRVSGHRRLHGHGPDPGPIDSDPETTWKPTRPRSPSGWCSISSRRRPCSAGPARASTASWAGCPNTPSGHRLLARPGNHRWTRMTFCKSSVCSARTHRPASGAWRAPDAVIPSEACPQ